MVDSSYSGAFSGQDPPDFDVPRALCRVQGLPQPLRISFGSGLCFLPPLSPAASDWPQPAMLPHGVQELDGGSSLQRRTERPGNETTLSLESETI
eukprot:11746655-Karenia_brevis.AAC.1